MVVINFDNVFYECMFMFLVDVKILGIEIICNIKIMSDFFENEIDDGIYVFMKYNQVWVLLDVMLGEQGGVFKVVQVCLGGGCIYYCMCIVGLL